MASKFPNSEAEIADLALQIVDGLENNPGVYPAPPIAPADLTTLASTANTKKLTVTATKAANEEAVVDKNTAFDSLVSSMKEVIRYCENTVGFNNEKLTLIGWSGRKTPEPTPAPGQPSVFTIVSEGEGTISFEWVAPGLDEGGKADSYVVERRIKGETEFGPWTQAGYTFETQIELSEQPRGVQMEYRVSAVNLAGKSVPSNTTAAVL